MRQLRFRSTGSFCDLIILFLIGCFLFQSILGLLLETNIVEQIFPLSIAVLLKGYIWTFLTYGFLHGVASTSVASNILESIL